MTTACSMLVPGQTGRSKTIEGILEGQIHRVWQ